jgi:uncharacterized protein
VSDKSLKKKIKMLKVLQEEDPWYAEGLRFECTGCGQCCTGSSGYVWLNEDEIVNIAAYLKISLDEFAQRFLRRIQGNYALLENRKAYEIYDCVFLKNNKCEIYPVRPTQCKTFPWWPQHLESKEEWEAAAKYCEGIRLDAPITSLEKIEEQRKLQQIELDKME